MLSHTSVSSYTTPMNMPNKVKLVLSLSCYSLQGWSFNATYTTFHVDLLPLVITLESPLKVSTHVLYLRIESQLLTKVDFQLPYIGYVSSTKEVILTLRCLIIGWSLIVSQAFPK